MARPLVVALALDDIHLFEFAVACEVFGTDRRDITPKWPRFAVAGPRRVTSSIGLTLAGLSPLSALARASLVVVPGWEKLERAPSREVVTTLQRAHERGATVMSFCSGAFALGHAGLLDGRRSTTHWMFASRLSQRFPLTSVDPNPLWVRDGRVWTAAGTAAAIDCSLAWVAQNFGQTVANEVARRMVTAPTRSGGQQQFIVRPSAPAHDPYAPLRRAIRARPEEKHTVASLATLSGMTPRTFARHFRAETGASPYAWVIGERVAYACELLERGRLSVEEVAAKVGMDAANLRTRFREEKGLSPFAWRRTFGGGKR